MRLEPAANWSDGRVSLFQMTPERVSDRYVAWLNDARINRYLESRFARQDRAGVEAFAATALASDTSVLFGIEDCGLGRHVGNIKLGPIDRRHGLGEVGIMIGDSAAWGRGIGSAAIARVGAIAADQLGLRRLTAGCYASNRGSERAFAKAGFVVEGVRPAHFLLDGVPEDLILMGYTIAGQE